MTIKMTFLYCHPEEQRDEGSHDEEILRYAQNDVGRSAQNDAGHRARNDNKSKNESDSRRDNDSEVLK